MMRDQLVLDEVQRLAAAAGCDIELLRDVASVRARWSTAPLVLLDLEAAIALGGVGLPRRRQVVVLSSVEPEPVAWESAVKVGADQVFEVVAGRQWLAGALADAVESPAGESGRVLAVVGARGGAGASVLSAAVALVGLRAAQHVLLIDCDPLGGGLDLLIGAEEEAGLRWPDMRLTGGRVAASTLCQALPGRRQGDGSLTLLSCAREGPGPEPSAVAAVVDAGRRAGHTVICDLARDLNGASAAVLDRADLSVVVVPAEVRACAAARRMAEGMRDRGLVVHAVVRGPAPGGLTPTDVCEATGMRLLTSMRSERGLASQVERGRFMPNSRGSLVSAAQDVLAALHDERDRAGVR
ncbi:MAG: hypothetical protein J2O49_00010 [Sciscionella sp.]|nr:hypothetical protein [Sciscionella sp.]